MEDQVAQIPDGWVVVAIFSVMIGYILYEAVAGFFDPQLSNRKPIKGGCDEINVG